MSLSTTRLTPELFEQTVGSPLRNYKRRCHEASILLVRSGVLGESRVARGFCRGVNGQHSWVVLGMDCYDADATLVDPTLWSYDETEPAVWYGKPSDRPHVPHGSGSIWNYGRPAPPTGPIIELKTDGLSETAKRFLDLMGPLDRAGWGVLAHAPVGGLWPAAEIFGAMYDDPRFAELIPVDVVGMVTDRNPMGLYLP